MAKGDITTKNGLLYNDGKEINLPEADGLAQMHGFMFAERLVDHLEKGLPFPPKEVKKKKAMKKEVVVEADSTLADMIRDFRDLKDQKADLNKAVKELTPKIEYMSEIIIARLQGEGADKISTPFGTVSTSTKDYATIQDFGAFIHFIDTHQAYELIQKRPNDAPLRLAWDSEEEGGEEIPGIGKYERTTLNFRKK